MSTTFHGDTKAFLALVLNDLQNLLVALTLSYTDIQSNAIPSSAILQFTYRFSNQTQLYSCKSVSIVQLVLFKDRVCSISKMSLYHNMMYSIIY